MVRKCGAGAMYIDFVRVAGLVVMIACFGCVERKLWVRTDPAGAIVRVNGDRVGTSPVAWKFHQYGVVLVEVEKEGYLPEERAVSLRTPWYQKPVLDFVTDVVLPTTIHDDHEVEIRLEPEPELDKEQVREELAALTRAAARARQGHR
ncbi:MAG: PEGA domain-containing protein [Planctomycetota bacterium]|nr:PEGA domain-containing protein [Planctomycetota bacterium]